MKLHSPFLISSRLLPALQIGGAWIQLEYSHTVLNRDHYRHTIDLPSGESFSDSDLSGHGGLQEMFCSLLSFLDAAAESYRYHMDYDKAVEADSNATLFPREVVEWAYQNSDEISMTRLEIEESETALIEE